MVILIRAVEEIFFWVAASEDLAEGVLAVVLLPAAAGEDLAAAVLAAVVREESGELNDNYL